MTDPAPMRIHALTVDRGGCFWYRIKQPLDALRRRGHWTSYGGSWDPAADVWVAQYLHYAETIGAWVAEAELGRRLCVWEADDDIWNVTSITGHGNAYDDPETVKRMERGIAASHVVTVTTPELAELYARINPNVVVLPNSIPDWLPDLPVPPVEGPFTIGYSCSPSHQEDLAWFAPTLAAVMEQALPSGPVSLTEVMARAHLAAPRLRLYGPDSRPLGVPASWDIDVRGWQRDVPTYLRSLSMDVGIAPLKPMAFNSGKSGIKALEYQALGIWPVVADFPQYRAVVRDGVTGSLCSTQRQWIDQLTAWRYAGRDDMYGLRAALREHARQWTQSRTVGLWEDTYAKGLAQL